MKKFTVTLELERYKATTMVSHLNTRIHDLEVLLEKPCFDENEDEEIRGDIRILEQLVSELMNQTSAR
jgi:hypothetical protein